ncbi:hypothetical protein llap_9771 [Limosa lapponica baueri]|uniref:Uncharacterized protein n=1 Tax=Limosa lapponica baueri TaxID=1758121 RepID=A0A2I0U1L9_LIMLA|nr:hypothetical protein llap_9771 [Limosa lapponica baueri]
MAMVEVAVAGQPPHAVPSVPPLAWADDEVYFLEFEQVQKARRNQERDWFASAQQDKPSQDQDPREDNSSPLQLR